MPTTTIANMDIVSEMKSVRSQYECRETEDFFLNFKSFYLDRICEDNSNKAHGKGTIVSAELATNGTEFVGIQPLHQYGWIS